jgi:hypothetical protein
MNHDCAAALKLALELSRELLAAAERGDAGTIEILDAQRLELLKLVRQASSTMMKADQKMIEDISHLNDQAIGYADHFRRAAGRKLDTASVGRRALVAYGSNQP